MDEKQPDYEERTPNQDYYEHKHAAEELGEAALDAEETQDALDAKRFKKLGYEKIWARNARARLEDRKARYDRQLHEAASHIDFAHEQALHYEDMAKDYNNLAVKLKEEFGIELPTVKGGDMIKAAYSGDLEESTRNDVGTIIALTDLLEPVQEVEGNVGRRPARLPRKGLFVDLETAEKIATEKGMAKLLEVKSGAHDHEGFYHNSYTVQYLPLSPEMADLIVSIGPGYFNHKINRSYDVHGSRSTGMSDLRNEFSLVSREDVRKQIETKNMPLQAELHFDAYERRHSRSWDRGVVDTLSAKTPEEMKSQIIDIVLREHLIRGNVVVDGEKMSLEKFLTGKEEAEEQDSEAA